MKKGLTLPLRGDDTILLVKKNKEDFYNERIGCQREKPDKIVFRPQGCGQSVLRCAKGRGLCPVRTQRGGKKHHLERVGVQLQSTQYQTSITVEEACIEYASLYTAPADYPKLLEQFGLGTLRKSFVSRLSGGERQKLSVVLALIGSPEIVFLDELTTGLDVVARREVWRTLKQLKEQGLTIFLTTHYMEEAEALCDRVYIIKSGKKVAEGAIDEVIAASGQKNMEDAYLFFMGEEELL